MKKKLSIEVEGSTPEEAIEKALLQLKVARDQVKVEILNEEQKGLFGMPGAKLAKVRLTVIK
jgi:spoIIIJ-associated protein